MSMTLIRIAMKEVIANYGNIPAIHETIYRDGKMIFVCENGERFWYSFASGIVAKLGR